jgi:hypothetical protein
MNRACILVLATLAVTLAPPGAAQRRDSAEAHAFMLFLQSVVSQHTALMCERGVPGYRQRFDDLYGRWSAKHRAQIARGEKVYRSARANKEADTDRARLEQIDKALADLAGPSAASPIPLDNHGKALCDEILGGLNSGLQQ